MAAILASSYLAPNGADQPLYDKLTPGMTSWLTGWSPLAKPSDVSTADPDSLKRVLQQRCMEIVAKMKPEEWKDALNKISRQFDQDQLEVTLGQDCVKKALDRFKEAKMLIAAQSKTSLTPKTTLLLLLDKIVLIIDAIVAGFGIGDVFKHSESSVEADFNSHKIMELIAFFATLSAIGIPLLGGVEGIVLAGGIMLAIAGLSLIWPSIKPMASRLPCQESNVTREIQCGVRIPLCRKERLDTMARNLSRKQHIILTGPTGTGKGMTVKAFTQAIENGEYPELKGKVVIHFNTTNLANQKPSFLGGRNTILQRISEAMGRHRENFILVFDEIHMACKKDSVLADALKTILDKDGAFPYVIGVTTAQEYKDHIGNNLAFKRRFREIEIKNTTDEETINILSEQILQAKTQPLIEKDICQHIVEHASIPENMPQPLTDEDILAECIHRIASFPKTDTDRKIAELTLKIQSLRQASALGMMNVGSEVSANQDLRSSEEELGGLLWTKKEEEKEIQDLLLMKQKLDQVRLQTAVLLSDVTTDQFNDIQSGVLLNSLVIDQVQEMVLERAQKLGVKLVIDKALVDEVIQSSPKA